ncbi:gigaxonin-like [Lingula anatina]|uniref:Gigaxonin-like n=1 Tax=Lingula anatina TaxID=7574 RepID=A0A2R2MRA4_LINAN|nr:gigaxonin-like [Lingula anatina]|eukprot:XP_023932776.1 gigaxonin-like [Lingula anatina]
MARREGGVDEKSLKNSHPLHASNLLKALNDGRWNPHLCDGTVVIKGRKIAVQKNVLAAASPYFRAVYSYQQLGTAVDINEMDPEIFEQILDYIYTSVIMMDEENIQDILQAADILLMADLKDLCCDYLEQCISVQNVLGVQEFAERFSCPRVYHAATLFLDEHFSQIIDGEEFLQLSAEKTMKLLQRDSINSVNEETIFDCIIRWCGQESERLSNLKILLSSCLRIGALPDAYFQDHVLGNRLVKEAQLEMFLQRSREERPEWMRRGYSEVLVAVGGEGPVEGNDPVVEVKATVTCVVPPNSSQTQTGHRVSWIPLKPLLAPRAGHSVVSAGGYIYAIGGRDASGHIVNTGERYCPHNNQWTSIAPMSHARVGFGLTAIDDHIYALGGSNDMSDPLTSVEEYNIYTNKWRTVSGMNLKRAWSAFAVLDKKIYVLGGGIMGKLYEAVECYDPKCETWYSVPPMKERRFDARAVGHEGSVYVFGGLRRLACPGASHNGAAMRFCDTEVFPRELQNWTVMPSARSGMCTMSEVSHVDGAVSFQDEILVCGELDVGGVYHFARAYDHRTDSWRGVILNHPPGQRGMQLTSVKIPNAFLHNLMWSQETAN